MSKLKEFIKQVLVGMICMLPEGTAKFKVRTTCFRMLGTLPKETIVNPGDIVIQAGCWRTETVEGWSRIVGPNGKVIVIEADDLNLDILKVETRRRELNNVILVQKALWNRKEKVTLQVSEFSKRNKLRDAQTFSPRQPDENYQQDKSVEADTMDNILKEIGIDHVNHINMEISGAEIEAIEGMTETLGKKGVRMLVRSILLKKSDGQPVRKQVAQMLRDSGHAIVLSKAEPERDGGGYVYSTRFL